MIHRAAAILLALAAATLLPAAKPVPPADPPGGGADDARERWRGQGISVCVAELRAVPELGPDDLEGICGCAFDRFLEMRRTAPLPPIESGRFQGVMEGPLMTCTARTRPDLAGAVMRRSRAAPPVAPPTPIAEAAPAATGDKPAGEGEEGPAEAEGSDSGGGFRAWLATLSLPAWLSGASILWWIAIGIFVFGVLILKFRARDPRNDLTAPPTHLRRGAPPQPPRRPDLPR